MNVKDLSHGIHVGTVEIFHCKMKMLYFERLFEDMYFFKVLSGDEIDMNMVNMMQVCANIACSMNICQITVKSTKYARILSGYKDIASHNDNET